jgi:predicted ATPase
VALELLDEAFELGGRIGERCHDAELYRVRGEIRLAGRGDDESQGLADLLQAVEIARGQRAVSFEIRSILSLLTLAPELASQGGWIERLEDAVRRLETSENSHDERAAWALIARERQSGAHVQE